MATLLTRDEFRASVFSRDRHTCVFCSKPAVDAHHILDRKLWSDGGYYLENGASVCEEHHLACEMTHVSCEEVRKACGIKTILLPAGLSSENTYDKWGNIVLCDGRRLKGPMFHEENVQRILGAGQVLDRFVSYFKYPRTMHLPWSQTMSKDDRMLDNVKHFMGRNVVVTEKMDGENTSMYCDHIHARAVDSKNHPSRNWVKNLWGGLKHDIPEGWRICGENLFATHSIHYTGLESYFLVFSIWNNENKCLSWSETKVWAELFNLGTVPVLYEGLFDEKLIKSLWSEEKRNSMEGYVVRVADSFAYDDFESSIAKFVRSGHVQTDDHWSTAAIVANELKS